MIYEYTIPFGIRLKNLCTPLLSLHHWLFSLINAATSIWFYWRVRNPKRTPILQLQTQTQTNAFKKQNRNCSQGQDIIGIPAESSWACVVVHMFADTFPSFSCLTWFNLKISVKSQNKLHIPEKREKQFWLAKPWWTYATLLHMFSSRIRYNYIMLHTNVGLLVHRTPCITSSTQYLSMDSSSQVLGRTIEHTILQLQTSQPSTYIIGKACEDQ